MIYKKMYKVEELDCPECAMNIVDNLEKLEYIKEAHIDYDNKTITIIGEKVLSKEQVDQVIEYILNEHHCEQHNYHHLHSVVTDEFNFKDIDCPVCASKVENALNKDNDIIDAQVDFLTKKIIIKHLNNVEIYDVVSKIVKKYESGAVISKTDNHHHGNDHHDSCHCHSCDHHEHKEENKTKKKVELGIFIIGVCLFVCNVILSFYFDKSIIALRISFIVSYILIGYEIIYNSIYGAFHKDFFNENCLMFIASIGALIINEPIESIMVILLYRIGEFFQDAAADKSQKSIQSLMESQIDYVTLKNGEVKNVKDVNIGDIISVKVGERLPVDGIIKNGNTEVDMKALTGESRPIFLSEGEDILSGSINLTKVIDVEVTKDESQSTISKVLELVQKATKEKSKTEKFITKFANVYTPCILIISILVGIIQYFIAKVNYIDVLNNVFSILVISCPCALVISIPLGYFAGIGRSSQAGIFVKGGNYLEALSELGYIVFDKTGTITKGNFKVIDINPAKEKTKEEVLELIAKAEQYSTHPIAKSIQDAYGKESFKEQNINVEEISGLGLKVTDNNKIILVGNNKLMELNNVSYVLSSSVGTNIYLCVDNQFYGSICIGDEVKENCKDVMLSLNKMYNTVILTGDSDDVAQKVATEVGVKEIKSSLLPNAKYEFLRNLIKENKKKVAYVGDGINDTPALKIADVGIAMGNVGSDSAKECADVVIANDDLHNIVDVIKISKYTKRVVYQNIIMALSIKLIALIIGIFGWLGSYAMLIAVFADVGVCLLAILNTMKILRYKLKND